MKIRISFLVVWMVSGLSGVPAAAETETCAKVERISVDSQERGGVGESYPSFESASADGRYVAFVTYSDLTGGNDADGTFDVYLRDREAGSTRPVGRKCVPSGWVGFTDSPSLSADGRWLSYVGMFPCDVDADFSVLEVTDLESGETFTASLDAEGHPEKVVEPASLSGDGSLIVYSNRLGHIILKDLRTARRTVISDGPSPGSDDEFNFPHITPDGRFVLFTSFETRPGTSESYIASTLYDRRTGTREVVSIGPDGGVVSIVSHASISDDGRYVVFEGFDPPGIFLRDRQARTTTKLEQDGFEPIISHSGRYVASIGLEGSLIGTVDPVIQDVTTGRKVSVIDALGVSLSGDRSTGVALFTGDDKHIVFSSFADGFVPGDNNHNPDAFLTDVNALFATPGSCSETPETQPAPSAGLDPEGDKDADGVKNGDDNCPYKFNPGQQDVDDDGKGDFCDVVLSRSAPAPAGGCELVRSDGEPSVKNNLTLSSAVGFGVVRFPLGLTVSF